MDEKKIYFLLLLSAITGNTGSFLNYVNPDVRADSFTGLNAAQMKAAILAEMHDEFEKEHARHIQNEMDINNLRYRTEQLEGRK